MIITLSEVSTAAKSAATTSTAAPAPTASAPASSVTGITAGAGATVPTTPPRGISIGVFASPSSDKPKKQAEEPAKTSSPRSNKTAYADNLTAALLMLKRFKVAGDPVKTLKKARDLLVEHAARRVDLAFYLLVAYYKTRIILDIDETTSQHGMGSKKTIETNACHSALISTVKELFRLKPEAKYAESLLRDKAKAVTKPCLPTTAHFKNILSMTTELPRGVNYYDIKLEGKLSESGRSEVRKVLLTLLNEVSCGERTPFQALKIFFIALKKSFSDLEESGYLSKSSKTNPAALRELAHAAVLQGTFKHRCGVFEHEGKTHAHVVPEYPASLLRLKPEDFARVSNGVTCEKEIEEIFAPYYSNVQKECCS